MLIRERSYGHIFEVFGIYGVAGKTYFLAFPRRSYGLSAFPESEVEIVDSAVGADFVYHLLSNGGGVLNQHLVPNMLLDRLLEHEQDAYDEFVRLLGREPRTS